MTSYTHNFVEIVVIGSDQGYIKLKCYAKSAI